MLEKIFKKKGKHEEPKAVPKLKKPADIFGGALSLTMLSEDEVVKMLRVSPEKLREFETYYHTEVLPNVAPGDDVFEINAKHATAMSEKGIDVSVEDMVTRIVDELLHDTKRIIYDGNCLRYSDFKDIETDPVSLEEIRMLPKALRPELTGRYMKKDIDVDVYKILLWMLWKSQNADDIKEKRMFYNQFRQGLDIVDVDPIISEIIGMNRNSMSHWLPELVQANVGKTFFKIPKTIIAKLPVPLLQLTRVDFMALTPTTKAIVDRWAVKAFDLSPDGDYFIKTGTYSQKYDFRNCRVAGEKEVLELGEYLLFIHFAALQMASPLSHPVIYGASTTNEWVVREFVADREANPTIYKGLPLHTEYRVFVDCDDKRVLGIVPYWEPETMKKRFSEHRDGHDVHDELVYKAYEEKLMSRYDEGKGLVLAKMEELVKDLSLEGQWSIDVMQNGKDFWIIDMAIADQSFGYTMAVRAKDRKKVAENWIPELNEK